MKTRTSFKRGVSKAGRRARWPRKVQVGHSVVTIYRNRDKSFASGVVYVVTFQQGPGLAGRKKKRFADRDDALAEAKIVAAQLNAGKIEAADMSGADRDELQAARQVVREFDVPLLAALKEWKRVRELTEGHPIQAAEAWRARNIRTFDPINLGDAVDAFIAAKIRAKKQGERIYRSKLKPLVAHFGAGAFLDSLTATALDRYLAKFENGTTRNDMRKRAVALWKWAQRSGHLPHGVPLEIEGTERATEKPTAIGILKPDELSRILEYTRSHHPEHLAGLVLACFAGLRQDEIHGKRADRDKRQLWEDVHTDRKPPFVAVTVAKTNTPAWRQVPLCPAAVEWLSLHPEHKGAVIEPAGMEKLRWILKRAKDDSGAALFPSLPENAFRHSFISYRVAQLEGDKVRVAAEAGNSPGISDRHYRVPLTKAEGEAWFAVRPQESDGVVIDMKGKAVV